MEIIFFGIWVLALEARLPMYKSSLLTSELHSIAGNVLSCFSRQPFTSLEILFGGELTFAVNKWAFRRNRVLRSLLYKSYADSSLFKFLFR